MRYALARTHVLMFVMMISLIHNAAFGGTPLYVQDDGTAYRWNSDSPVEWNPDQGTLGAYSNDEAILLMQETFDAWESVEGSAITFEQGDSLSKDVTASAGNAFLYLCEGISPIIFDADGSLTNALFGQGASCNILGFASPQCSDDKSGEITEGLAVINGRFVDNGGDNCEVSESELLLTMAHELGHMLNLGHSQINGNQIAMGSNVVGFESHGAPPIDSAELMYPYLLPGTKSELLSQNERAWLSWLNPTSQNGQNTGSISGTVYQSDGTSPLQGVNMIARNPNDPFYDAVSAVSGFMVIPGTGPTARQGDYELPGLPTNGAYVLGAEEINPLFVSGSGIPPLDPPADINNKEATAFLEFYSASAEAGTYPPDNPLTYSPVTVTLGSVSTGINISMNFDTNAIPPCEQDSGCDDGQICLDSTCLYGCRLDSDCENDQICNDALQCQWGCREDEDCPSDEVCTQTVCKAEVDDTPKAQGTATPEHGTESTAQETTPVINTPTQAFGSYTQDPGNSTLTPGLTTPESPTEDTQNQTLSPTNPGTSAGQNRTPTSFPVDNSATATQEEAKQGSHLQTAPANGCSCNQGKPSPLGLSSLVILWAGRRKKRTSLRA